MAGSSPGGRTAALDNLHLLLGQGHAPEAAGQLVAVKELADGGLDRAAGGLRLLCGQGPVLDRRLAVLGEAVGERAGAGQRVWVRRVVDVLCGQGDVSV